MAVQRGWVARDNDVRTRLPPIVTPAGEVEVRGRIAPPPARLHEFDGASEGPIRQNLDLSAYARETGVPLLPLSVRQEDDAPAARPTASAPSALRPHARPTACCAAGRRRPSMSRSTTATRSSGSPLGAVTTGLYVWFQIVQPRRRRAASARRLTPSA